MSEWTAIDGGVHKDNKLGPLPFLLMKDLKLDDPSEGIMDDINVLEIGHNMSASGSQVQRAFDNLQNWTRCNGSNLNPKKTKGCLMCFQMILHYEPYCI